MVTTNDEWFIEMDGEQVLPSLAMSAERSERVALRLDRAPMSGTASPVL